MSMKGKPSLPPSPPSPHSLPPSLSSFSLPSRNATPITYTGKGGKGGKAKGGGKSTAGGQTIEIKRSKDRLTVCTALTGRKEKEEGGPWREKGGRGSE